MLHIHRVVLHYFLNLVFLYFFFFCFFCGTTAGVDPGFPVGGGADPLGEGAPTYYFVKISEKLHEIEKIWDCRGAAPPKSATALIPLFCASVDVSSGF